jgi:hypothetical protein
MDTCIRIYKWMYQDKQVEGSKRPTHGMSTIEPPPTLKIPIKSNAFFYVGMNKVNMDAVV